MAKETLSPKNRQVEGVDRGSGQAEAGPGFDSEKLAAKKAWVARKAITWARIQLKRAGIEARREERARKKILT
ncbi:hypothetical protein VC83_07168 [Pseudogymnoascus destructans]|uniref:Uncharacterized protein n=1 Tax=Pseudogymnoascus destructans TaxID=655981 RepID=A0A177A537_9PEZI|nr:uncharacterized protein VC83_07168 [Pseudogymnoascus destructans]OAF56612.1 hypothetical protein VC83_07168 [Pseudogymnoascus destructans]